jgi:glycolate dehydrogenase FAD-linked subunit
LRKTYDPAVLEELSHDAGVRTLEPKVAYFAESEADVVQAAREASDAGLPITARGGGTSIPTQSVGLGAILMQSARSAELVGGKAVCKPGIVKSELNQVVAAGGRWMPVDPSSYASCTVGGMVANNASGIRTLKYGSTIDYVEELRAVFPGTGATPLKPLTIEDALSGDPRTRKVASLLVENQRVISEEKRKVTKNSSGYRLERVVHDGIVDIPKLFAGSEGTLGILTEVTLGTRGPPSWKLLFIAETSPEEIDEAVSAFREHGPSAIELLDKAVFQRTDSWKRVSRFSRSEGEYMLFCEFDGESGDGGAKAEEVAASRAGNYDPIVLVSQADISEAWGARNETLALAQGIRRGAKKIVPGVEDLVAPPERLGDLIGLLADEFRKRGLEYILYGHAGDANLHARPLLDLSQSEERKILADLMEECFEGVWKMGGSMSGEHGDGMLRAGFVERQYPKTHWIMREVKELYDPGWVLNPGVKLQLRAQP